jgi:hypothetical protein
MAPEVSEPVADEEIAELQEELQEERVEVRGALADDLGGDPDDYRADRHLGARSD